MYITDKFDIIIIGAGPSGLMASIAASKNNKKVLILEKNKISGRKLRITGKGRCNITNVSDDTLFFDNVPTNPKFLFSSFYNFNNYSLIDFFNSNGLETVVERGGRVFPKSQNANDVADLLETVARKKGVKFVFEKVLDIEFNFGFEIKTNKNTYKSEKLIIATGGKSYQLTGSTGDGYKFAEKFGHKVNELKPSLVPIKIKEDFCRDLQGLSLKNVSLKLYENNIEIYNDFGEMLFTHFGISGPIVLSASSHIRKNCPYKILIDLKPALDKVTLDKRLLRDFSKNLNKDFSNSLDDLLPKSLISVIVANSGISGNKKVNSITKAEREKLIDCLKNFELNVVSLCSLDEAIVTSGGISVKEINPSTMESKLVNNLYFCGEIIDVDAYTGGYNLQIAFSTGYSAGENASK